MPGRRKKRPAERIRTRFLFLSRSPGSPGTISTADYSVFELIPLILSVNREVCPDLFPGEMEFLFGFTGLRVESFCRRDKLGRNLVILPISDASSTDMYYANCDLSVGEKTFWRGRIFAAPGHFGRQSWKGRQLFPCRVIRQSGGPCGRGSPRKTWSRTSFDERSTWAAL